MSITVQERLSDLNYQDPPVRGVLAGLPHTIYRLPDRAPRLEGPGRTLYIVVHMGWATLGL